VHRFYSPYLASPGDSIDLPLTAQHQCARVLRLRAGELIALFDGSGREIVVRLTTLSPGPASGTVISSDSPAREPAARIVLAAALSRQERWEWMLQKGTELGAACFQPVETARCVVHFTPADWRRKAERWEKIILEAVEQCGGVLIPALEPPISLAALLAGGSPGVALHLAPALPGLGEVFRSRPPVQGDRLLVGPEGGLTEEEYRAAIRAGWIGASLGPRTLRCETAAIAALAVILEARNQPGRLHHPGSVEAPGSGG
jgi:16S rRNA (uracil1498-N3)-methyltransferase